MDGCVVAATSKSALQGVRNQHRVARSIIRVRTAQLETGPSGLVSNEFEIKRNKAHGGCLGIERR